MNKVYQVIWSRVRHCYMAVAETVARSHYKHSSKSAAKATWAAVAAAGLLTGIPACSMAQGSTIAATNQVVQAVEGPVLTKDTGKAKKAETPVFSNKELKKLPPRVTFPMNFMVMDGESDGVYITEQRYNNDLKGEHIALGEGSVAFDQQKGYSGLFAAGINAVAGGKDAIAIGNQASATGNNFSIAIGSNAEAPMPNSIALGEGSIANLTLSQQGKQSYLTKEDWNGDYNGVLSLGRDLSGARAEVTRRIIHVAGGAADTDAVNVKQLKALEAKIPKAVDLSKYTTTDKLGAVIEQKLGDTYAKKADIPAAKIFKAVGDGISVTEKDNVITYMLDTSKLPQSSTGVYITEQRYNNDLKGEHIALGEGSVAFDQQKGYSGLFAAGINAVAGGKDAIAIGNQASATGNNFSIAIGSNAEAPMPNSIALGEGSIANLTLSQQGKQSYLTKEDWNGDYNGVLSLGRDLSGARAEVTRRIIHVAGGAADTDAVNVKQLKALEAKIPKAVDLSKYTTTDKLGAVIEQKLGDTYAKKADIPAAKTFKAVGDGISVTEKDNVITYTLDTSKLPQSSTGVYITEQRYNNDLKGEHIALGEGSVAFDQQKGYSGLFAAGINAVAGGKDAIAIGHNASATGQNFSIAIGSNAEAPMSNSIALGEGSIAKLTLSQQSKKSYLTKEDWNGDYNGVLSLGRDLSGARAEVTRRIIHVAGGAADTDAVNVKQLKALEAKIHFSYLSIKGTKKDKGTNYNNDGATGNEAIAIGQESQATGNSGIAIGVHSKVMGLENNNLIKGDYGTAIGAWASVKNNDATALGAHTHAWGERSLAIGDRSVGNGIESVAIGSQALADSFNAIAIGGNSSANLENAIAIGKKSKTEGMTSIAIGSEASTGQKGDAQKSKERVKELKNDLRKQLNDPIIHKAENAIAIGTQAKAWQTKAVSLGAFAKAQERESLALGDKSFANGIESVAIGHNSSAQHISAIALGDSSLSEGIQSIAIGKNAQAGNKDEAFKSKQQLKKLKSEHKDITNDDIINASFGAIAIGSGAKSLGMHAMSLGLNAKATAVNSIALGFNSEAKSVTHVTKAYGVDETWDFSNGVLSIGRDAEENKKAITRRITHIASGGDDYDAVNVKQLKALEAKIPKAVDLSKYTPTDQLGAVIDQKLGDTYAKKADIPAPKTFKAVGGGISVTEKDNVVTYTLDMNKLKTQLSGSSSAGTNGKSAYEVWEEYTDGNGAQPNKGKKESDFLASLKGKDGTNGTNGKSAYEVWEEHKDVNGAQPNKGKSESDFLASLKGKDGTNGITAAQLEQVSQGMQTRMAALGKHMNSMGAGNAALAALHPMEFDPDDKLEAAVGVGHYGDANAAALGMFYHPDENTLISVGGAFGKDKNVMNAGISFRIGKGGNGMLLTKTALATAVKQQNIVIHQQEERIRQLERENKARDAKLAEVLQVLAQVKR
ncbi:hypothetical protein CAL30_01760 [Megasphaera hutchinsoni]|uniref:Hep/Hag repeat protein n=1 Tax=Megasphaera hutchinsoni TaxID=1588748 RepID=A0A2J8BC30_9FIRM|nr:ESPR-type extended signal peptide-containing protein [Megasphaera genomosp. type_2]PNH22332.1 hypothetical protein CAL30_01760 [Megasphaera genomosp. type_2]